MPNFTTPDNFKEHKQYVALLKKALLVVKPDAQKKFLYFKQYPFGAKKFPLVLVDFDMNCQAALAKAGHKPTDEGLVSLTPQDELNFEPKKGALKRVRLKKYFATLGGGLKSVFVPPGEVDDEGEEEGSVATPGQVTASSVATTQSPERPSVPAPDLPSSGVGKQMDKKLEFAETQFKLNQRITELGQKAFQPEWEAKKKPSLDMAKTLVGTGKFADATKLLDLLAAKVIALPPLPTPPQATGSASKPPTSADVPKAWVSAKPTQLQGAQAAPKTGADKTVSIEKLKAEKDLLKRIQLCETMLEGQTGYSPERDQVEDILAEAKKQWGVEQAKAAYAAQMKGVVHEGDAQTPAYNPGGKFDPKNLAQKDLIFDDPKVKKLMQSTGLTEGEVLAIRAYTASNYKYINPAVANQKDRADKEKDWMDIQNRPDPSKAKTPLEKQQLEAALKLYEEGGTKDKGSKKSLYEEGALHAGMMTEAFKKLPKKTGTLYRGARMNAKAFNEAYSKGKEITYEAFVSQSTSAVVARGFANGGGDFAPPDDATTSVFVEAQITDARDLMALSVYGSGEAEWLLPPGTKLRVESINDDKQKDKGRPPAKAWKKVTLKQVVS